MHACTLLNYSRLALNALFSELKIKLYFPEFWSEFWILARILADFWILARILADFWILARILAEFWILDSILVRNLVLVK